MSYYMNRLFPKSNSSLLLTKGKAIKSQVVRLREDKYLVDSGLGTPKICKQDELTGGPRGGGKNNKEFVRFEDKVGFMDLVSRESLIREQMLERFFIDLVAGEPVMKERAAARFDGLVGSEDGVAGELNILLPRRYRQNQAWLELMKNWRTNKKVRGFVIEKVRGGYSVGIAGFVGFLPNRPGIRKRLANDRFTIQSINPQTKNILLF